MCYILVSDSPRSTPRLSKATLRCRLQDSKFVSDKQNKHIAVDRAIASALVLLVLHLFSLNKRN